MKYFHSFELSLTGPPVPGSGSIQNVVTVPPIGPDELPPPYTPSPQGGIPMINCKVCQSMINIEGKTHQHVVKCNVCNEATVSIVNGIKFMCVNLCFKRSSLCTVPEYDEVMNSLNIAFLLFKYN